MNEKTPVSAYRLLSNQCDKSIVFVSSRGSPCMRKIDNGGKTGGERGIIMPFIVATNVVAS